MGTLKNLMEAIKAEMAQEMGMDEWEIDEYINENGIDIEELAYKELEKYNK